MIILLSPTKKQEIKESLSSQEPILFSEKKNSVLEILTQLSQEQIKKDYKVSDKLASETYESFQNINEVSPAIFTYTGEAFKTMEPTTLSQEDLDKLNSHLLIFSALYGLVKPYNPITKYRLDLINKFEINLKDFWSETITDYLNLQNRTLINLASKEYSQLINQNELNVPMLNIHFINEKDGKRSVVSSHAKKARGHFTRALIENGFDDITSISVEGYEFSYKADNDYYYIKTV